MARAAGQSINRRVSESHWQHHFGRGMWEPSDLATSAKTNESELWMAGRYFVEHNWSTRKSTGDPHERDLRQAAVGWRSRQFGINGDLTTSAWRQKRTALESDQIRDAMPSHGDST